MSKKHEREEKTLCLERSVVTQADEVIALFKIVSEKSARTDIFRIRMRVRDGVPYLDLEVFNADRHWTMLTRKEVSHLIEKNGAIPKKSLVPAFTELAGTATEIFKAINTVDSVFVLPYMSPR